MIDLGTVRPGATIRIPFSTFDKDDSSSITMTNFAAADILVYKDGSTTERASTSGYTATTDFDAKTGKHLIILDLADNTTAGFWNAGSEYVVAIDAVTVDAVTVGAWVARFRIGYDGAMFDTTLATLASQTSFTLTVGPAEDDALNGCTVIIHDIASAVQCGLATILDYTGSTKTVTLAAGTTFTAAAGDNISVMFPQPLQPTTAGRALDVSAGGEAGVDWANVGSPTTALDLSNTTIKTTQKVDVETIKTQSVTLAGGVTIPAATLASTTNISAGTVTTATNVTTVNGLAAGVITAASIAADAITAAKVADGTIDAATFAAGAINAAAIAADAITAAKMADGAIDAATFAAGAINAAAIASAAIGSAQFAAGAITSGVLADDAITAAKIADGAIDAATFAASAITSTVLATNAITAAKIAGSALSRSKFDNDTGLKPLQSGTAQAGGANSITLDLTASATDDLYNGAVVLLTSNTGVGQAPRLITDYDGTTKIATVTPAWVVNPDVTSGFAVLRDGPVNVVAMAASTLTAAALATDAGAEIADAVWDEVLSGHLTSGTTGAALNGAGAAGDPWGTTLPGAYGAGTAGKIVGDNVNATISSRATQTTADAIQAKTDNLPSDPADHSLVIVATDAIYNRIGAPAGASVSADVAAVKTDTAAIKTKTDSLTFTTANQVDARTRTIDATPVDTIWDEAIGDSTITGRQAMKILVAVLAGKLSGAATTTISIRNAADSANVVVATVDADGNRSAVTLTV